MIQSAGCILVVDDNKVNRLMLTKGLEQQGYTTGTAENGKMALDSLRTGQFDLMLLDIEMPEMNGFQVLDAVRNDPKLRHIPIIMISAMDEQDSVVHCIEMGAEDYLTKPPNPVLLRARVSASLEKKRLRDEQRRLFRTFTTQEVAEELLDKGFSLGGNHIVGSAMFADIRGFTTISESQDPAETIELLNSYYAIMFDAIQKFGGNVNQIQGDGILAIFGAPAPQPNHAEQAVRAGIEMLARLNAFNQERAAQAKKPIKIGIGIASGQMVAGYAGTQNRATYTCIGDTVNLAARIEAHTKVAGKALIVETNTFKALPPEIEFESLGTVTFKGKSMAVAVFALSGKDAILTVEKEYSLPGANNILPKALLERLEQIIRQESSLGSGEKQDGRGLAERLLSQLNAFGQAQLPPEDGNPPAFEQKTNP
jgi:class 3 adenylate cyclase